MSARQLLDQLMQSGRGLLGDARGGAQSGGGLLGNLGDSLGKLTGAGGSSAGGGLGNALGSGVGKLSGAFNGLGGTGKTVLGAGALAALVGSKKVRKVGGKVALYGGMAALGAVAYHAYRDWQSKQPGNVSPAIGQPAAPEPRTLDRLPAPEAEQHSHAILRAMLGAAKADGHIDAAEQEAIRGELDKLDVDAQDHAWLEAEIARPLDPAEIARIATTPEMAAEMYLASLLVVDEESYMERAYLDELARQLKLDPGLKQELEQRVRADAQAVV